MSTGSRSLADVYEARPRWPSLREGLREYWYIWLVLFGLGIQTFTLWRVLQPVSAGGYPPLRDSLIFEYIGWYLTEGGRLYVDVWEVKPPLPFEVTAVLAWLADGSIPRFHAFALAVTNAAAIGTALVVGLVTFELTEDEAASFTGGLVVFAYPAFHWRAAFGFKPKYFVVFFGLLAVYLAFRRRPVSAGLAGAAAVGFWQLGLVFPVLSVALVGQHGDRRDVFRWLAGAGLVSAVMLAPIVWWGAVTEMIAETVLTPLLVTNDGGTVVSQVGLLMRLLGRMLPLALLGLFGLLVGVRADPDRRWWLVVGAGWFALQVLALDLDGYPDLIPAVVFVALGLGLALGDRDRTPSAIYGLVFSMVAISVATLGPHTVGTPVVLADPSTVSAPYRGAERSTLFWRSMTTETCRPFFGLTQYRVIELTGGSPDDVTCGTIRPLVEALQARYLPST